MGKRDKDDDLDSKSGDLNDLPQGELKPQLAKKPDDPLDGLGDVSLSPIETW